eukprot:CAMPEP_0183567554 /NCGR_PEP_ID=MMETSP0371-20130417/114648_1 /TAXON_ID=268820 /ORGANISM="Peridinium aciculiferum, Strain PAER-2" /LENGTH=68 /DNA_ID=CAMNT_0025776935 /DNA_START=102 /DNA_END=304 /DNA_ORIENTATION=-
MPLELYPRMAFFFFGVFRLGNRKHITSIATMTTMITAAKTHVVGDHSPPSGLGTPEWGTSASGSVPHG